MSEDRADYLVAARVEPGVHEVPGSKRMRCDECHHEVTVAPSGQRRLEKWGPGVKVLCVPCGLQGMREDPDREVMAPAPDQLAEIIGYMRRN